MNRRMPAVLAAMFWLALQAASPALAQSSTAPGIAASAPSALPKSLPLKRGEEAAPSGSAGVLVVALLLAAGAAGVLLLRRRSPGALRRWKLTGAGGGAIVRVASQSLTPQASVHLVHWRDEELLLACTPQQVTVVARKPATPPRGEAA